MIKLAYSKKKIDFIADSPRSKTSIEEESISKEEIAEEVEQTVFEETGFDLNSGEETIEPTDEETNTLKEEEDKEEPEILPDDISNGPTEDPRGRNS